MTREITYKELDYKMTLNPLTTPKNGVVAMVTINLSNIRINGICLREKKDGSCLFLGFPSVKSASGEYSNVVHPTDLEFSQEINSKAIDMYEQYLNSVNLLSKLRNDS